MPDFQKHEFQSRGATFHSVQGGQKLSDAKLHVVWGHGWGQDHKAFLPLAEALAGDAAHTILDFPGFGQSPPPPEFWDTQDYANAIAAWLKTLPPVPVLWVGHSFGGRVGLRLAAQHPNAARGLFLIASAGLKRKRSVPEKIYLLAKVRLYKTMRSLAGTRFSPEWLQNRLGSADYRNSGIMRPIFVKTVNEDQTESVKSITCPVRLIYGEKDNETPPEMGQRLSRLIPRAELTILPGQDHYSVLGEGRHQILHQLHQFMKELSA